MKNKNPLYVVKGKDVLEVRNLLDLVITKLNLTPAIKILQSVFNLLLSQVTSFVMFSVIKDLVDELVKKLEGLRRRFSPAT